MFETTSDLRAWNGTAKLVSAETIKMAIVGRAVQYDAERGTGGKDVFVNKTIMV